MDLQLSTALRHDDGVVERPFTLGDVPGVLWTPDPAATAATADPAATAVDLDRPLPLVLLGHPGGLDRMLPRVASRARDAVARGFAAVTLELPGSGSRPALPDVDEARAALREAVAAGERPTADVVDRLVLPLVDRAVPEWQAALDALGRLPGLGGPVAVSGGVIAVGVRLAAVEPRVVAASLFAGSVVPGATLAEARTVTVPVHVLLQWDDAGNDRQAALDLFDAFGSAEKTLQANLGGHTGVPAFAADDAGRFLARHLG